MIRSFLAALLALSINSIGLAADSPVAREFPDKPADLYDTTTVWTIHLKFTAEQYEALQPKEMGRGIFGGGPVRNEEDFGPAMFLAPTIQRHGDQNSDGKISASEFTELAANWFSQWDKNNAGKLDLAQLRTALNEMLTGAANAPGQRVMGIRLLGEEGKRNGLASAMGVEFNYAHADLEFEGKEFKDVAVRYKGNGTWLGARHTEKRSLKIDLNEFVKGQKIAGIAKLNLHTNVTDPSWMNEPMSHRLYRDAGVPAARSAYARVYLSVPGKHERKYLGLYSMIENIDKDFVAENIGSKKGALLKPVTPDLFAWLGKDWARYNQIYDPKTDLTEKQKKRIIEFCKLLTDADDEEFAARVGEYVDLDEFSRYMAVTVWLSTLDSILMIGQNYLVYLDPSTNKFQFIPWDLDHSFGQFFLTGTQEQREQLSIHHPWKGDNRFLARMFGVEEFKKLYLARLEDFSNTIFKPERFHKQVDEIAAAIKDAAKEESPLRLERLEEVASGKTVDSQRNGPDGKPQNRGGPPVKPIKPFVTIRHQAVLDQLAGKTEGFNFDAPAPTKKPTPERPNNFGPGFFLAPVFMTALDANKDAAITRDELVAGFARWFESWNTDNSGHLTAAQLRAGINKDLTTTGFGPFSRPLPPRPQ